MANRPDPTDTFPQIFSIFGETADSKPFRTGFWTRDFIGFSPPQLFDATAYVNVLKAICSDNISFSGWGIRNKSATIPTDTFFAAPITGVVPISGNAVPSYAAAFGYGGIAIDNSGVTRNIRTISHCPRGHIDFTQVGSKYITVADSAVAGLISLLRGYHATDSFGRQLSVYGRVTLQQMSVYQQRSGQ